jgi:hypothetical protein
MWAVGQVKRKKDGDDEEDDDPFAANDNDSDDNEDDTVNNIGDVHPSTTSRCSPLLLVGMAQLEASLLQRANKLATIAASVIPISSTTPTLSSSSSSTVTTTASTSAASRDACLTQSVDEEMVLLARFI